MGKERSRNKWGPYVNLGLEQVGMYTRGSVYEGKVGFVDPGKTMQKSCILGEDIYYMPGCVHSTLAALMFTNKTRNQVKDDGSEHMSSPAMRKMQMGILTTRLHTPVLSADSDCGGKGPREASGL